MKKWFRWFWRWIRRRKKDNKEEEKEEEFFDVKEDKNKGQEPEVVHEQKEPERKMKKSLKKN